MVRLFGGFSGRQKRYTRRSIDTEDLSTGYDELYQERSDYMDISTFSSIKTNFASSTSGYITDLFSDAGNRNPLRLTSNDTQIDLDLHYKRNIKSIILSMDYQVGGGGPPNSFEVVISGSNDGSNFNTINSTSGTSAPATFPISLTAGNVKYRFIRLRARRTGGGGGGTDDHFFYYFHIFA